MTNPSSWRRRFAAYLVSGAARTFGSRGAAWARAMRGELPHVPDEVVLGWAWGCLWMSCRERLHETPMRFLPGLRRAARGLMYGVNAIILLFGCLLSAALVAIAVMKPFTPEQVGVWVSADRHTVGFLPAGERAHELVGFTIIPLALLAGVICIIATHHAFRWVLRFVRTL